MVNSINESFKEQLSVSWIINLKQDVNNQISNLVFGLKLLYLWGFAITKKIQKAEITLSSYCLIISNFGISKYLCE